MGGSLFTLGLTGEGDEEMAAVSTGSVPAKRCTDCGQVLPSAEVANWGEQVAGETPRAVQGLHAPGPRPRSEIRRGHPAARAAKSGSPHAQGLRPSPL